MTKHPEITVALVGEDGNAFAILTRVKSAMKRGGISNEEIDTFMADATAGDYNHLLTTVMETVTVE